MSPDNHAAIHISDLHHRFSRTWVLRDISLTVRQGESIAISGSSGGGKTTLLSCILGLIKPTQGTVTVVGQNIAQLSRREGARFRNKHVGMIFQKGELLDDLTAEENVALPSMMSGKDKSALQRASELLDQFQVPTGRPVATLSGGEYQRVAFARAILNQPQVLLADEPTASLDPEIRDELADILFRHRETTNTTLVVVSHDPAITAMADTHYVLRDGRLELD